MNEVFERQILLLKIERIFFLWNEGKNQKYSIWMSIFSIVSLKFLAFKKKSHNLNCFVSPTEQSCAYHILYNSDVI